jgi:hypothetical protein
MGDVPVALDAKLVMRPTFTGPFTVGEMEDIIELVERNDSPCPVLRAQIVVLAPQRS